MLQRSLQGVFRNCSAGSRATASASLSTFSKPKVNNKSLSLDAYTVKITTIRKYSTGAGASASVSSLNDQSEPKNHDNNAITTYIKASTYGKFNERFGPFTKQKGAGKRKEKEGNNIVQGHVKSGWEPVRQAFEQNYRDRSVL